MGLTTILTNDVNNTGTGVPGVGIQLFAVIVPATSSPQDPEVLQLVASFVGPIAVFDQSDYIGITDLQGFSVGIVSSSLWDGQDQYVQLNYPDDSVTFYCYPRVSIATLTQIADLLTDIINGVYGEQTSEYLNALQASLANIDAAIQSVPFKQAPQPPQFKQLPEIAFLSNIPALPPNVPPLGPTPGAATGGEYASLYAPNMVGD